MPRISIALDTQAIRHPIDYVRQLSISKLDTLILYTNQRTFSLINCENLTVDQGNISWDKFLPSFKLPYCGIFLKVYINLKKYAEKLGWFP